MHLYIGMKLFNDEAIFTKEAYKEKLQGVGTY